MDIRPARASDVAEMARIRTAGGGDEAGIRERIAAYLAGTHDPREALGPRAAYVAREGDALVGYAAAHLTRRYGCDGELQWIYVVPGERGSGVAAELLRAVARWLVEHGAARVCVDVVPGNTVARRFYRRHGAVDLNRHWLVWNDVAVVLREGGHAPASPSPETSEERSS